MDLNSLDVREAANRGTRYTVLNPGTGEPTPVVLTLLGYDSEVVEEASREAYRQLLDRKDKPSATESLKARKIAMAQAAVVGVEGGTGATATVGGVQDAIARPGGVWLMEQIEGVAGNRATFFKNADAT